MKRIISVFFVIIILALGIYFAVKYSDTLKNSKNIISKDATVSIKEISSEVKNFSDKNNDLNYEVNAEYPEFSGLASTQAQEKINQDVKSFVIALTNKFKEDSKTNCNFSNLPNPPSWVCELAIAFDGFNLVNNKILSLEIEYYQFTGGAHGGTTFEFLNYNVSTGERINWQSAFKTDSDYLKIISDYSKNNLNQQLLKPEEPLSDAGWIEQGTTPTNDNYNTNVGFDKDGLIIVFQQYQVAAYAAGPQQVAIPYSQLESAIDPSGLLGK